MSKIVAPVDTISITIDNTKNPPQVVCNMNRELPPAFLCMIFAQLIAGFMQAVVSAGYSPSVQKSAVESIQKGVPHGSKKT